MTKLKVSFWKCQIKFRLLKFFLCAVFVGGCSTQQYEYATHNLPDNINENVRFKNFYYFRVVDYCKPVSINAVHTNPSLNEVKEKVLILNDNLYRFTLTGKANKYLSNAKFEAGIVKASVIDPFGSDVEYNEEKSRFYLSSNPSSHAGSDQWLIKKLSILQKLNNEYPGLLEEQDIKPIGKQLLSDVFPLRRDDVPNEKQKKKEPAAEGNNSKNSGQNSPKGTLGSGKNSIDEVKNKSGKNKSEEKKSDLSNCPTGTDPAQGYLVMGPQGWKRFSQEERLVLAMYTDSKPLIETLTELSVRLKDARVPVGNDVQAIQKKLTDIYKLKNQYLNNRLQDANDELNQKEFEQMIESIMDN